VEANSTGGHGSRRAVAPSDDDDDGVADSIDCHSVSHVPETVMIRPNKTRFCFIYFPKLHVSAYIRSSSGSR
jgi:hypothetical protein